jgi:GT2 family glycosyltransferase
MTTSCMTGVAAGTPPTYREWLSAQGFQKEPPGGLAARVKRLRARPLVSVLTPVYGAPERFLRECIDSVLAQAYPAWELCLVDDASPQPHVAATLEEYARRDARVRVQRRSANGGICAATADALAMSRGEIVAFLDHDDLLTPDALLEVVAAFEEAPDADLVYSDEDHVDADARPLSPHLKPDWSPELLRAMNYVCHLSAYRRGAILAAGGIRPGYDGSQDYDLVLRVTERARRVVHVPRILYRWRVHERSVSGNVGAKPYAYDAARMAIAQAAEREGHPATVTDISGNGRYDVRHALPSARPPVTLILTPPRDPSRLPARERLVREATRYDPVEIAVASSTDGEWAGAANAAAGRARGEYLAFLDATHAPIDAGWLDALVEHAVRPGVGAVGGRVIVGDSVHAAGLVLGLGGIVGGAFRHQRAAEPGYQLFPWLARNCSAVSAACMMVKRSTFQAVNGFDERFAIGLADVDLCLRLSVLGHRTVYTPHASILGAEPPRPALSGCPADERLFLSRWAALVARDPYYHPMWTRDAPGFALRAV